MTIEKAAPTQVNLAVKFLWAGLIIVFLPQIMGVGGPIATALISLFIVFPIHALIIVKISRGANWARITYLVLTLLMLPFSGETILSENIIVSIATSADVVLTLIGLWLVFTSPGSAYFKKL